MISSSTRLRPRNNEGSRGTAQPILKRTSATALSGEYESLYSTLLERLGEVCHEMPDEVCFHWPMRAPSYSGRLLVVGQALNEWMVDGPTCSLVDPSRRKAVLAKTRATSESASAWSWMWPEPWSRPFWRLVRGVMRHQDLDLDEIAWSNLAKVAPARGGNPWGKLLDAQHEIGGELLRREVRELDPDLVLVLSGRRYLEPFLRGAGLSPSWVRDGARQFDGQLDGRRWLVVNHPGTFARRLDASLAAVEEALAR